MIPSKQPERKQMIEYMINACKRSDELTKWEEDFILSVDVQFESKDDLSDRQCEILEKIYDKL